MSKHKRTRIVLAENRQQLLPVVDDVLRMNMDEMETIRRDLAQQQLELLNRRGYLASAIKQIDEHLEIINNTLRMIEANQR
jgi:hypothetical protein